MFGWWALPTLATFVQEQQIRAEYVVLLPNLNTLLERAMQREARELHDTAAITGLYEAFRDPRTPRQNVIDTTTHTLDDTIQAVRDSARDLPLDRHGS